MGACCAPYPGTSGTAPTLAKRGSIIVNIQEQNQVKSSNRSITDLQKKISLLPNCSSFFFLYSYHIKFFIIQLSYIRG